MSPPARNWIRFAKTTSRSRSVLAFRIRRSTPRVLAADRASRDWVSTTVEFARDERTLIDRFYGRF